MSETDTSGERRRRPGADEGNWFHRWSFRENVISALLVAAAGVLGLVLGFLPDLIGGIRSSREHENEMNLVREQQVMAVRNARQELREETLAKFSSSIPRSLQITVRQQSLSTWFQVQGWYVEDKTERFWNGKSLPEVSDEWRDLERQLLEEDHYASVCALAKSRFGTRTDLIVDSIQSMMDLLNDVSAGCGSIDASSDRFIEAWDRIKSSTHTAAIGVGTPKSSGHTDTVCKVYTGRIEQLLGELEVWRRSPSEDKEQCRSRAKSLIDGMRAAIDFAFFHAIDAMNTEIDQEYASLARHEQID